MMMDEVEAINFGVLKQKKTLKVLKRDFLGNGIVVKVVCEKKL